MDKPKAFVTAPFRGEGLEILQSLCSEVVVDAWIDHRPLRLYNSEQLAERTAAEGADLLIVESDSVKGPVLELPLVAIGSCRGDPTNVDVPAATAHGSPVRRGPRGNADAGPRAAGAPPGAPVVPAPGGNADAVAGLAVGPLLAGDRGIAAADLDVRAGETYRD